MRKLGTSWRNAWLPALLLLITSGGGATITAAADTDVPWLGVTTQALSAELREGLDYEGEGVLISRVMDDSPADQAGLRKGDVIVSVNGRSVGSPEALTRVIRGGRVDQAVSVVVVRDGQRRTLSARLAARPDDFDVEIPMPDPGEMPELRVGDDDATLVLRGMGRGRLGVRAEDLGKDLAPYFNAPEGSGALVLEVMKDTPAERAGIKAGDVVTQVGQEKVSDADGLVRTVRGAPAGKVSVTVLRRGVKRTFEVELEAAPRALRGRIGRDLMVLDPRERRTVVRPDGLREELREMREELRELRQKLEKLERRD